jgi:hypothetical protein
MSGPKPARTSHTSPTPTGRAPSPAPAPPPPPCPRASRSQSRRPPAARRRRRRASGRRAATTGRRRRRKQAAAGAGAAVRRCRWGLGCSRRRRPGRAGRWRWLSRPPAARRAGPAAAAGAASWAPAEAEGRTSERIFISKFLARWMVLSYNKLIVIGSGDGPDFYQAHAQISDQSAPPQLIGSAQAAGQAAHSTYLCGTPSASCCMTSRPTRRFSLSHATDQAAHSARPLSPASPAAFA